jgi:hypothetical protein
MTEIAFFRTHAEVGSRYAEVGMKCEGTGHINVLQKRPAFSARRPNGWRTESKVSEQCEQEAIYFRIQMDSTETKPSNIHQGEADGESKCLVRIARKLCLMSALGPVDE